MLKHTFCHVQGIGARTEQQLWASGICSWEDLLESSPDPLPLGKNRTWLFKTGLGQSMIALQEKNPKYFCELLASDQHWRIFPQFRDSVAYLDIETTGLGNVGDHITTIALYDGSSIRWYAHGKNLEKFAEDIKQYKLLVTYNGKTFDLPFIRNNLGAPMDHAHIDLRYILRSLGYRGGLKACEKQLGIDRKELNGVDGYTAVLLWSEYRKTNNLKALETLLAYNIMDVVNLESLMVMAYNLKLKETPFLGKLELPPPLPPPIPFEPDAAIIEKMKRFVYTPFG